MALTAVLMSGYGESTVAGAGAALVTSIGGFYAFKRGSAEFRHLEDEVHALHWPRHRELPVGYAGHSFEIGGTESGAGWDLRTQSHR